MPKSRPALLQRFPLHLVPDAQERLSQHFDVINLWEQVDSTLATLARKNDVTVLITNSLITTPREFIDQLPNLQAICNVGVGYDAIDVQYAQSKGIQISNTPNVLNDCVADLAWGLMLATMRNIGQAERYVRMNQWGTGTPFPLGAKISGKKLGIVGLGRVGLAIAKRSIGFEMDVRYHNRHPRNDVPWVYEGSLMALAKWADILMIATVGGPTTQHLVDQHVLSALGPQGFLVNIARGSVVDQSALVNALLNGQIRGAGLDVFEAEPYVPDELKNLENVVLLPHIASATIETRTEMMTMAIKNVQAFAQTGKVLNAVQV